MTFPILVTQTNGTFTASVLGSPEVAAEGPTKEQAVAAVTEQLRARVAAGEVVLVNVPSGVSARRRYSDEELAILREQTAEIYRQRDAQKAAEWPE